MNVRKDPQIYDMSFPKDGGGSTSIVMERRGDDLVLLRDGGVVKLTVNAWALDLEGLYEYYRPDPYEVGRIMLRMDKCQVPQFQGVFMQGAGQVLAPRPVDDRVNDVIDGLVALVKTAYTRGHEDGRAKLTHGLGWYLTEIDLRRFKHEP